MAAFNPVGVGVLVILGGVFAYQLAGSLRTARALLTATDPVSAGSGDAVVAVGTPSPRTSLVDAPVSGAPCCGYLAVLHQRYRSRLIVQWHPDYVVGELPRFTLDEADSPVGDGSVAGAPTDDALVVDLENVVNADEPASSLRHIAPPGDRFSPIDIGPDATTDTIGPGTPLPDRLSAFEDVRDHSYPVRVREHRIDEDDELTVVGRTSTTETGTPAIDADGLIYVTDRGYGHAASRIATRVLVWLVATLVFLVPAVLYTYATLIA